MCRLVTPPVPVSRVSCQICWGVGGMDMSMAIWAGVLRVCGHGSAGGALRSPARSCYGQPCVCEPACDSEGEGRHAVRR